MNLTAASIPASPSLFGFLRRWSILIACCLCTLVTTALAQSIGTVTGRVYDEATGRSLQGAVVTVEGSTTVDYTDADGRYTVSAPAGQATIVINYVGLDPLSQKVTVSAGATTRLNAPLKSDVLKMDSFVVQESARGQALAINQQKIASGIVNIVSEETFGEMVDNNIGQALQRLPGISVNEDQDGSATGFNIRGIEASYNSFQVDGNRIPNSGTNSRAFDARQFDASGVTNIEVIKAPTPDRDGDAIGGIINVISRSAFQRDGRFTELELAGVYSDLPEKWGHSAEFNYSDIFSVGGKEDNLGISLTLSSQETNRYSLNADMDWIQVTPANNPSLNLEQWGRPVWFMESTHWEYDTRVTDTLGFSSSLDFRTDEFNSFYVRPTYSRSEREGTAFETDINIDTRFQDAVGGRKTYAELTPNYGRGTAASRGTIGYIGTDDFRTTDLYSISFGGKHDRNDSLLTYDFYYGRNEVLIDRDNELNMEREPDDPPYILEYIQHSALIGEVAINRLQGPPFSELAMDEGELEIVTGKKTEDVYSAKVDWEKRFTRERSAFTLKTGAKYRMSNPVWDRNVTLYEMDEDFPYEAVTRPTDMVVFMKPKYHDVIPQLGVDLLNSNPGLFEFAEEDTIEDSNIGDYDAEEETSAAYVMGTWRWGRHSLIAGVRYERVDWSNVNKRVSFLGGDPTITATHQGASYDFWLPGVHLRHELRPNLILRESFNQSYGRPNLAQLTRGRLVDDEGNIADGNPNLQPVFSNNFDVQLEYYTEHGGLYSVGLFYKDIEDFTFNSVYDFDDIGPDGIPIPNPEGEFEYEVPLNGSTAKNYGVELIARQRLVFLPDWLKGFSTSLSATFTETDATYPNRTDRDDLPLPGFSSYLFTAALEYARGNFFARADYRYRDRYVEGLGSNIESDEFYAAEERVDAEIGYRFSDRLTAFAYATNLTDRPQVSYQGYEPFVEDSSIAGTKYTVGLRYKF